MHTLTVFISAEHTLHFSPKDSRLALSVAEGKEEWILNVNSSTNQPFKYHAMGRVAYCCAIEIGLYMHSFCEIHATSYTDTGSPLPVIWHMHIILNKQLS